MTARDKVSITRLVFTIILGIEFLFCPIVLGFVSAVLIDQMICIVAIDICFFLIFLLFIIRKRINNQLKEQVYNSYGKISVICFICFIITILCANFAPDYFAPVMLIPILLNAVLDNETNIITSIYFVLLLSICQNFSNYVIICYILLVIFAAILGDYLTNVPPLQRLYSNVLLFSINILIQNIFYYFAFIEISTDSFKYGLISSSIILISSSILLPLLTKSVIAMQSDIYDMILDPDYGLCEDIRKFSYIEYQHALRVSRLSKLCANEINANEMLAAAGGFYYRIGKMEGEPMIDNAIKLANDHCFPDVLIKILSEYGGIMNLPSSKESAIVHMVDSVVTKVELFDSDSMTSSWNQNMVIYQTINELSQKGIYDESGLTMNQFLIIREKLANEDILA